MECLIPPAGSNFHSVLIPMPGIVGIISHLSATENARIVKTMVAGMRPENLDIDITRSMVSIKGTREATREIEEKDYYHKELYWGTFARSVTLPEEIDVEESEATEKNGLLTIRLPKIDKAKQNKLKVKSS